MDNKNILLGAIFFVLMILSAESSRLKNSCSGLCHCEGSYMDCRGRSLDNPSIRMTRKVMSLDLSQNDVRVLNSSSFSYAFEFLRYLNFSKNYIDTVTVDSFAKLLSIEVIDLSQNRIKYMDDRLIESNTFLHTLILDGNFLITTTNQPMLRSQSLRTLSMRRASIKLIDKSFFSELPLLEYVDLAFNLLQTINPDTFSGLQQLQWLDLSENYWTCEDSLLQLVANLIKRGKYVSLQACDVSDPPNMQENLKERLQHTTKSVYEVDVLDSAEVQIQAICSTADNYLGCLKISSIVLSVVILIVFIFFAIVASQIHKFRSKYEVLDETKH